MNAQHKYLFHNIIEKLKKVKDNRKCMRQPKTKRKIKVAQLREK